VCWGIYVLCCAAVAFDFYLGFYGRGGGPRVVGGRLVLFNHGTITPISADYYELIEEAKRVWHYAFLGAVPLGLFGFIACLADRGKTFREVASLKLSAPARMRLWARLFVPLPSDPYVTCVGKAFFLLLFLGMFVYDFALSQRIPEVSRALEAAFIRKVVLTYVICLVLAVVVGLVLSRLRRPDGAEPMRAGRTKIADA